MLIRHFEVVAGDLGREEPVQKLLGAISLHSILSRKAILSNKKSLEIIINIFVLKFYFDALTQTQRPTEREPLIWFSNTFY